MKTIFIVLLSSLFCFTARASVDDIPYQPPSPCYEGCTAKMQSIVDKFSAAAAPDLKPTVYSGECYHLSRDYDPNHTHYAVTLIDLNDRNEMKPYLSTIFSFFSERDEAADWDLARTRKEMSDEWKSSQRELSIHDGTARTIVWTGDMPSYVYWLRQDPTDGTLYMLTYWDGVYIKSFCELRRHP